ncbi:MAG: C45 family autoproteolytic acyltransferase/hydrolase [Thermoplasmatota archaeon]
MHDGWLEERDGIPILHVVGSHYDMGYQHGFLLRNETRENVRAMLHGRSVSDFYAMWNITKAYIPRAYIEELQGLADGAGIPFGNVAAAYMSVVTWGMGCFGIAAWGDATKQGDLYHFRSFDLPMDIQDPVTGTYMHENAVLIVRDPQDGYASISASIAGSLHGGGGFNEKGVAVGIHTSWTDDITIQGTPATFRIQMTLDHAATATEAASHLVTNGTTGWSFIVSDCHTPVGYAVETTANHSYVGTHDSPVESTPPFWSIPDVVRRTNFFIAPETAATQRSHYDPSGIRGFIRIFTVNEPFFVIWRSYKAMSDLIEMQYGAVAFNTSMDLFQRGYRGDTDPGLKILLRLTEGTSFNRAWNMWVADTKTGDFDVAFASREQPAQYNEVHRFNFYELLEAAPP